MKREETIDFAWNADWEIQRALGKFAMRIGKVFYKANVYEDTLALKELRELLVPCLMDEEQFKELLNVAPPLDKEEEHPSEDDEELDGVEWCAEIVHGDSEPLTIELLGRAPSRNKVLQLIEHVRNGKYMLWDVYDDEHLTVIREDGTEKSEDWCAWHEAKGDCIRIYRHEFGTKE